MKGKKMNENTMTVADILRAMRKGTNVRLTHNEEDNRRYINKTITETSSLDCFVKAFGWKLMDSWIVKEVFSEAESGGSDLEVITHIVYAKRRNNND